MIVDLKGVEFGNKGAELMLHAVLGRLRAGLPDVEFALTPGPNAPYRRVAAVGAWQRLRLPGAPIDVGALSYAVPRRFRRVARRYGVVMEPDVAAVVDASGFAYGRVWGDRPLDSVAREVERLARRRKPYVFLPQAFGPFDGTRAAARFGRALSHASLVCARDAESRAHLASLPGAAGAPIEQFPDFTLDVPGDPEAASRWSVDRRTALLIPNAEMAGPRNPDAAWRDGYLPLMLAIAARLRALGYEPRVLNHEGPADAALCDTLAGADAGAAARASPARGASAGVITGDAVELKGVIGAAGLVVSSRFHGCASALSSAVPCLATSWSHKYAALFEDFGVADGVLERRDPDEACRRLDRLASEAAAVSAGLRQRRPGLVARIDAMWQRVLQILASAA